MRGWYIGFRIVEYTSMPFFPAKTFERDGNSHCQILFYVRGSRSEAAVRAQVVRTGGMMGFFSTMELEACYLETRQGKITVK